MMPRKRGFLVLSKFQAVDLLFAQGGLTNTLLRTVMNRSGAVLPKARVAGTNQEA
jgi:hypothetical protein